MYADGHIADVPGVGAVVGRGRNAGPGVTWVGVVIKLDDGDTVALEFDGNEDFVTADVIVERRARYTRYVIKIDGRGDMWREGARRYAESPKRELEAAPTVTTGLCANRGDHDPHMVKTGSLAPYWCTADQSRREPYQSERRRREVTDG